MSCDFADKHAYDDMIEMNQVISLQVDLNATHFCVEFFFYRNDKYAPAWNSLFITARTTITRHIDYEAIY